MEGGREGTQERREGGSVRGPPPPPGRDQGPARGAGGGERACKRAGGGRWGAVERVPLLAGPGRGGGAVLGLSVGPGPEEEKGGEGRQR
jgi:hypothetical protein